MSLSINTATRAFLASLALNAAIAWTAEAQDSVRKSRFERAALIPTSAQRQAELTLPALHAPADDQETLLISRIREELSENEMLSRDERSIGIVIADGLISIRGQVGSAQKKNWIEGVVAKAAPSYKLTSQIWLGR